MRIWLTCFTLLFAILTTDSAIAQLSDCPYPYSLRNCNSVCGASGGQIVCNGGDYADTFVAISNGNGPFIWGGIRQAGGRTIQFCCDSSHVGSTAPLKITSGDGADTITAFYGDTEKWQEDTDLRGEEGDDTIIASPDTTYTDTLRGLEGNDILWGNKGVDYIYGWTGDDELYGDYQSTTDTYGDHLQGEQGSDEIHGASGADVLCGCDCMQGLNSFCFDGLFCTTYDGDDTIYGNNGVDWIDGGPGADTIDGGNAGDTIYGDYYYGSWACTGEGAGPDDIYGGSGTYDDIIYTGPSYGDSVDAGDGDDEVYVDGGGSLWVYGGYGDDLIDASGAVGGVDLSGEQGEDKLIGGPGNDILDGGPGWDSIYGNAGNDTALGYAGDDCFCGGTGTDITDSYGGTHTNGDSIYDTECAPGSPCINHEFENIYTVWIGDWPCG